MKTTSFINFRELKTVLPEVLHPLSPYCSRQGWQPLYDLISTKRREGKKSINYMQFVMEEREYITEGEDRDLQILCH